MHESYSLANNMITSITFVLIENVNQGELEYNLNF